MRTNIGADITGHREKWIIQGHIGSTWQKAKLFCVIRKIETVKE